MADHILVSTQLLGQAAHELDELKHALDDVGELLAGVDTSKGCGGEVKVSVRGLSGSTAAEVTRSLRNAMRNGGENIRDIASAVLKSVQNFEEAENRNKQIVLEAGKAASSYTDSTSGEASATSAMPHVDPFDDIGQYGGDQGSPLSDFKNHARYRHIIEQNTGHVFPNDEEFFTYLKRMNSEGCGYIAIVNSIFAAFKDDPDGFRDAFGFDMYKDGELNYNELFVDLYSSWDNKSASGKFSARKDRGKGESFYFYNYWSDRTGSGTSIDWRADISVQYLHDHGVNATAEAHEHTPLTADMYNEMVSSGQVEQGQVQIRLADDPATLYNADGTVAGKYSGGHAMTVTGTTGSGPDAMLEVSSWGKKYYVKPGDVLNDKGKLKSGSDMGYMILQIE